jgi:hypothetical protein
MLLELLFLPFEVLPSLEIQQLLVLGSNSDTDQCGEEGKARAS